MNTMANINRTLHTYIRTGLIGILLLGLVGCADNNEISTPPIDEDTDEVALPDDIKVISFNILEGMKTDRPNDYDNFVAWVQDHDPDVLALREVNGFRQKIWRSLLLDGDTRM